MLLDVVSVLYQSCYIVYMLWDIWKLLFLYFLCLDNKLVVLVGDIGYISYVEGVIFQLCLL